MFKSLQQILSVLFLNFIFILKEHNMGEIITEYVFNCGNSDECNFKS